MTTTQSIQFDQDQRSKINNKVLKSIDPKFSEVLSTSQSVNVYVWNHNPEEWRPADIVGTLFIIKRDSDPRFKLVVLNKKNEENLMAEISRESTFEAQGDYLMFIAEKTVSINPHESKKVIHGILFQNQKECDDAFQLIQKIESTLPKVKQSAVPDKLEQFFDNELKDKDQATKTNLLQLIQEGNQNGKDQTQYEFSKSDKNKIKDGTTQQLTTDGANLLNMLTSNTAEKLKVNQADLIPAANNQNTPDRNKLDPILNPKTDSKSILNLFGNSSLQNNPISKTKDISGNNLLSLISKESSQKKPIDVIKTKKSANNENSLPLEGDKILNLLNEADQKSTQIDLSSVFLKGQKNDSNGLQQRETQLQYDADQNKITQSSKKIFTPQDLFGTSNSISQSRDDIGSLQKQFEQKLNIAQKQDSQEKQKVTRQKIRKVINTLLEKDEVLDILIKALQENDLIK